MLHSALQLLDRSAQELGVDEGAIEVFAAACVFVAAKVELEPAAVPSLESVLAKLRSQLARNCMKFWIEASG